MAQAPLTPRRRDIGGLSCIEWPAPEDAPVIVMFHGYGADAADLAALAPELALPRPARWVFPDAPLALDWGGRAWFPIDASEIERAQSAGRSVDWSGAEPAGAAAARRAAGEFLAALAAPWPRLILGGFSQGSMLAVDLALRAAQNALGLAILSGNLVNAQAWRELAAQHQGLPFFQSHGIADPILGYQGARRLEAVLREGGLEGTLLSFEGGHAIPPPALAALRGFLSGLVQKT